MPRYLLAPEVTVLLSKVTDLRKRLVIDTQWNTGGRLNEILPLAQGDFVLDDPLSGAPLVSPFVVLRTLKQRRLEESVSSRSRRRGPCRSPIRPSSSGSGNGLRPCNPPPAQGSGISGQKVIQTLMAHKDTKSTEWYMRVFALDMTRQLCVRSTMDAYEAGRLLIRL